MRSRAVMGGLHQYSMRFVPFIVIVFFVVVAEPGLADFGFYFEEAAWSVGQTDREILLHGENSEQIVGFSVAVDYDADDLTVTDVLPADVTDDADFFGVQLSEGRVLTGVVLNFLIERRIPASNGQPLLVLVADVLTVQAKQTNFVFRDKRFMSPEKPDELNLMTGLDGYPVEVETVDGVATITAVEPSCLSVVSASASGISLTWTDTTAFEDGFEVERRDGDIANFEPLEILPENATSFRDNNVQAAVDYDYRVRPIGAQGGGLAGYSNVVRERSRAFELLKAKGNLGKMGWKLALAKVTFQPLTPYTGDGTETRISIDGIQFFGPGSGAVVVVKVNKKTGDIKKVIIKDESKNKLKLNLLKGTLKVTLKNVSVDDFDPGDSVLIQVQFDNFIAELDAPVTVEGPKLNKLAFEPVATGAFQPIPEASPCN